MNQRKLLLGVVLAIAGGLTSAANAANVVINPTTGLDSRAIDQEFIWSDGLGPIDSIALVFDPYWELTVPTASHLGVLALDGFSSGDAFELVVNGTVKPWTSSFFDGSGFFHGEYSDLTVSAGTTLFTLNVTALAPGFTEGGAWLNFSPATPITSVPDTTTSLPLFALGLAGVALFRQRLSR